MNSPWVRQQTKEKPAPQDALEVPLGEEQTQRLVRTDRLAVALEDDVSLVRSCLRDIKCFVQLAGVPKHEWCTMIMP